MAHEWHDKGKKKKQCAICGKEKISKGRKWAKVGRCIDLRSKFWDEVNLSSYFGENDFKDMMGG